MKNPVVIGVAGLVVGLLAGLGVGLVAAPDDGALRPGVSQQADQPIEPETPEELLADSDETETAPADESLTRQEERTLDDIVREIDIPPFPAGDGQVSGVVTTTEGHPLQGVRVSAVTTYPERSWRTLETRERIAFEIRKHKWLQESERVATTDENGAYQFIGLDEKLRYSIRAEADGWIIRAKDAYRWNVRPSAECDFVASARASLLVRVRLSDGSVPEEATIRYRTDAMTREDFTWVRGGESELTLSPGRWTIYAHADVSTTYEARQGLRSNPVEVEIKAGSGHEPITLVLRKTPGIEGEIRIPEGLSTPKFRIYARVNPEGAAPADYLRNSRGLIIGSVNWSDRGRSYKIRNLADGRYRVMLVRSERVLAWRDVTVAGKRTQCDLEFPAPTAERFIPLRIYNHRGEPVGDVEIHLTANFEYGSSGRQAEPLKGGDGIVWIQRHADVSPETPVDYFKVAVRSTEWGEKTVRYESDDTSVCEIHLTAPGFVTVTSPNFNEHPARGSLLWSLESVSRESISIDWEQARHQESPITLGAVEPGEYEVVLRQHVRMNRGFSTRVELLRESVTVGPGNNPVVLDVPPLHKLSIRIPGDDTRSGMHIDLDVECRSYGLSMSSLEFRSGVAYLGHVPAGEWLLKNDSGAMRFELNGDMEVEFKPRPWDCFRVSIVPPDGRIAELGIRDGDKLIEVDGEKLRFDGDGRRKVYASLEADSTTWIVMRNGQRTRINFDGKKLRELTQSENEDGEYFFVAKGHIDE